jgi:uncharacterized membrane protein (UPF0127 family)
VTLKTGTGQLLAGSVEIAANPWTRFKGLMLRSDLPPALVIERCSSVHTFFMRKPIDVAFCAKDGTALRIYRRLRPWRATRFVRGAKLVIETPAGALDSVQPGATLVWS